MRSAQHNWNRSTCSRFQTEFRRLIYWILPLHRANWTNIEIHTLTARLLLFLRCLWRFNCIFSNNLLFSFFWFPLFRVYYALTRSVTHMLRELVPHTRKHMRSMWLCEKRCICWCRCLWRKYTMFLRSRLSNRIESDKRLRSVSYK